MFTLLELVFYVVAGIGACWVLADALTQKSVGNALEALGERREDD